MNKTKTIIILIFRAICLILFPLAYLPISFFNNYAGEITFFTVQSNILVLITMVILSLYDILALSGKFIVTPKWVKRLKLVSSTSITLTFVVFGIILTPILCIEGQEKVVLSYSSIVMHQFIPLVAIFDWFLDDPNDSIHFGNIPIALIFPLYYFIFTLIVSSLGVTYPSYENGQTVQEDFPYFFLDYKENSWFKITPSENFVDYKIGVFYWLIVMVIILSFTSFMLVLAKNGQYYFKNKKAIKNV